MMDLPAVAVCVIVAIGAIVDVRTRRIPNLLTFSGAAAALLFHTGRDGLAGAGFAAGGWATGVGLFLPLFLLRGMGAGDLKLLGAVGSWLGPADTLWCAFYSVLAGGVLALVVGAWHGYLGRAFANLWILVGVWRIGGLKPVEGLTIDTSPGPRLAYGVAIAGGTVATLALR